MIVVDSSAVVNGLIEDPANPALLAHLASDELHAPALLDFEVASALRGHLLGGKLTPTRLEEALDDFAMLNIDRHPMTGMLALILGLRDNFTAYDAAYVILAQALAAPLVTSDAKLAEARRIGVEVHLP